MRSARFIVVAAGLGLSALSLNGCVSAPPAPLDPAASAARLEARSLSDAAVSDALSKAGLKESAWTLDRLTVAAWALRTDIASAKAEVAAALAAERTAGEIPNPTLSLDPQYLTKNANGNLTPWTLAASLGFTIETGGKRGIRGDQARADITVRRWQLAETFWKVRQDLRKAWITRALAQRALTLAEQETTQRQAFSAWTENAFRFGAVAQPERLAAIGNLAQAQSALRVARGDVATADAALAAAVGLTPMHFPFTEVAAPGDLLPEPVTAITALRDQALVNRLSVRRALADYDVTEQALRMAVAKQYPDIAFGPGYIYDKGDQGLTLNLGFTLPLFHGAQAAIDEAIAARAKAAAAFEAEQATALSDIESAARRYETAYAAWQEAKGAESATTQAATDVDKRLTAGFADRSDVITARLAQAVAQRATLDAERAAMDALSALEDGIQQPVWPASALGMPLPEKVTE